MHRIAKVAAVAGGVVLLTRLMSKGGAGHGPGFRGMKAERRARFEEMARQWHRREHERTDGEGSEATA